MPRDVIILNGQTFKTKKVLREHTSALLEKRGVCNITNQDADFCFFLDLYARKPSHEPYISDVIGFEIKLDPIKKQLANNLSCVLDNGNKYIFSWKNVAMESM